ncbi:hypothetical protein D3C71_952170 [compost metagenome]
MAAPRQPCMKVRAMAGRAAISTRCVRAVWALLSVSCIPSPSISINRIATVVGATKRGRQLGSACRRVHRKASGTRVMMAAKWPKIVRSTASSRLLGGGFDQRTYEMPRLRTGTNSAVHNDNDSSQRPLAASDGVLIRCR